MKIWENIKSFYIDYFKSNYKDYLFVFLLKHKLIRKSTSKKSGYTSKYSKLIDKTIEKVLNELLDYETIKTFTDSDDKTLKMELGFILANSKHNEILSRTFEELKTLNEIDIFEVVENLYLKSNKSI